MKKIPLTQGKVALVDDRDFPELNRYKWCAHNPSPNRGKCWYALRSIPGNKNQKISMHVHLLGKRPGLRIDHRNRNGLDCRRRNMRWGNQSMNIANTSGRARTGFKGVYRQSAQAWGTGFIAKIKIRYKAIYLGSYRDPIDAARAYNAAAKHFFGEFAWLNPV